MVHYRHYREREDEMNHTATPQRSPVVYISQENPHHDYRPAEEFGELVFLTTDEYSPVSASHRNRRIIGDIQSLLASYVPGRDFLLPSGSPVVAGIMYMVAGQRGNDHQILHWSNQERAYRLCSINLRNTASPE